MFYFLLRLRKQASSTWLDAITFLLENAAHIETSEFRSHVHTSCIHAQLPQLRGHAGNRNSIRCLENLHQLVKLVTLLAPHRCKNIRQDGLTFWV